MNVLNRTVLMLLLIVLAACTPQAQKSGATPAYSPLILISLDGYRADYIERGDSPVLKKLADSGVHADAMRSAFPTLTFPNHYTLVTGLYPDHHGIVNNRMIDPESGKRFVYNDAKTTSDPAWWGGEPLWVSVERQGQHAATMFWPGSDVAIGGIRPSQWLPFNGKMTPSERVDQALAWLDLPAGQRPSFLTLYFEQTDHAAHDHGPDSAEVKTALIEVDAALGRLVEGLKQRGLGESTNLVIVSDHGMTPVAETNNVVLDKLVDMNDINLAGSGVIAGLAPKPGHEAQVEKALLGHVDHMQCWRKAEIPARLHYGTNPRIPAIVCAADDGWMISTQEYLNRPNHHVSRGEHGYDNDNPNMRALFVARGPAFKHGIRIPEFDNVNVYAVLARILKITPQKNDANIDLAAQVLRRP